MLQWMVVAQIYSLADLHRQYKKYIHKDPSTFSYNCLPNYRTVFPLYLFFTPIFMRP